MDGLGGHVCLLDGSPEGPDAICGAPGRWTRLPSPVLTGAGSRVCGLPHSQRRRHRPVDQSRPGRRRGAPLSLQANCSSRRPADTNSGLVENQSTPFLRTKSLHFDNSTVSTSDTQAAGRTRATRETKLTHPPIETQPNPHHTITPEPYSTLHIHIHIHITLRGTQEDAFMMDALS